MIFVRPYPASWVTLIVLTILPIYLSRRTIPSGHCFSLRSAPWNYWRIAVAAARRLTAYRQTRLATVSPQPTDRCCGSWAVSTSSPIPLVFGGRTACSTHSRDAPRYVEFSLDPSHATPEDIWNQSTSGFGLFAIRQKDRQREK
jgi:hypothetical protein